MISVIMPTHNRAALLERAIHSVLAQTVEDWELIIIADNCSDNTAMVVGSFNDPRICYRETAENVGGAQARNIGLDMAEGEYLAFLDDDDEWLPQKLELQMRLFDSHDDIALASASYIRVEGGTERITAVPPKITLQEMYYNNPGGSFSFCMTTRALVAGLRLDSNLKACQDWDLWIRLLQKTGYSCYASPTPLVRYHVHAGERLSTNRKNHYRAYLLFMRKHQSTMTEQQLAYNYALLNNEYCCMHDFSWTETAACSFRSFRYALASGKSGFWHCIKLFLYPFWATIVHSGK